ncbi:MAG TPA: secondary thiamine-phosphate synthase [Cytophagales bacterium]|nr:secondary thiamine-phosphate synthase [Cytophagales bacterium]
MKVFQKEFTLSPHDRGFHIITDRVLDEIPEISEIKAGYLQVFIQHTSAGLTINENTDPTVREDFELHFDSIVPEVENYYQHNVEGIDDMPGHLKSSMVGCSVSIPITNGSLNLGTWQGIYLCEFRDYGGARTIVLTAMGV